MKTTKINIGVLFGGKSAEHDVSLQSAENIIKALDKEKYTIFLLKITKGGEWLLIKNGESLGTQEGDRIALIPQGGGQLYNLSKNSLTELLDVVFPVLHGPYGEDGTVQGLLKIIDVPFVGSDVLGSAVTMDKDVAKRLLGEAKIPTCKFLTLQKNSFSQANLKNIVGDIRIPCFVKPANMGSSIGISKVNNENDLEEAIMLAFNYDNKVIVEEYIQGRELECAILGNVKPVASAVGEVLLNDAFYSYSAKYVDKQASSIQIPADISTEIAGEIQRIAIQAFQTLECYGLSRVDFFLTKDNEIFVNEVNSIPGFTDISMYPKLWEESGVLYTKLIDKLIELAITRYRDNKLLKISL